MCNEESRGIENRQTNAFLDNPVIPGNLVKLVERFGAFIFFDQCIYPGEVVLTEAEFGLFFEGADLEKRFIESPREIGKKTRMRSEDELQTKAS